MSIKLVWDKSTIKKRKELAKTLGYKPEWGTLKYSELGKRGGGMLKRDLTKIYKIYRKKK